MDKKDIPHGYNGVLRSHKKEQYNTICSNMDAARDYHTKSERERQIYITYMPNLTYGTNEPVY